MYIHLSFSNRKCFFELLQIDTDILHTLKILLLEREYGHSKNEGAFTMPDRYFTVNIIIVCSKLSPLHHILKISQHKILLR